MDVKKLLGITMVNGSLDDEKGGSKNFIHANGCEMPWVTKALLYTCGTAIGMVWDLILTLHRRKHEKKKYYFSICAIFKDEELSLKQWVEYHRIIGVDHFYLYNNNSTDHYKEELQQFVDEGLVDLIEWPVPHPAQLPAYMDCFKRFKGETQWMAFIDLDEYIVPTRKNNIKLWIKDYEKYPAVYAYWKMFGDSGIIEHDVKKPVIEQYICSWDRLSDIGKSFVNTDFDIIELQPRHVHEVPCYVHFLGIRVQIPPVNEFRKYVGFKINRLGLCHSKEDFTIQINHYFSKSYDEYVLRKKKRGCVTSGGEKAKIQRSMYAYYWGQRGCTSCDYSAYKYLTELKVKLGYADHIKVEE